EGRTHVRSGWEPRAIRSATAPGSPAPSASRAAAKARAIARLPVPEGPWKRYACDGLPSGGSAGAGTARAGGRAPGPRSPSGEAGEPVGGVGDSHEGHRRGATVPPWLGAG